MANIEHVTIADPNIHEPKDISAASANTAYVANGLGTGTWTGVPISGETVSINLMAFGEEDFDQGPTATDTAHQILFGPGNTETGEVVINANGSITVNKSSTYLFIVALTFGRTTSSGVSELSHRFTVNGTQIGFTGDAWLATSNDRLTETSSFSQVLAAGDLLTFDLIRDSLGANDGGLFSRLVTASGWNAVPSASLAIYETVV